MLLILSNKLVRIKENLCRRSKMNTVLSEVDALFFLILFKRGILKIKFKTLVHNCSFHLYLTISYCNSQYNLHCSEIFFENVLLRSAYFHSRVCPQAFTKRFFLSFFLSFLSREKEKKKEGNVALLMIHKQVAHLVAFPVAWNISSEERGPSGLLRSSCDA